MKLKGKYSESAVLYAILLSIAGVLAVVVFFVVLNMSGGEVPEIKLPEASTSVSETEPADENKGYEADRKLANEMLDAAGTLIGDNYKVLKLYYTKGLAHIDEPYGNIPEDGYYTVDSDEYTALSQIEEIVDRTYIPECAADIKSDPLGYGAIYKTRGNGTLGIIANYTPMPYSYSWDNPNFEIEPVSETECTLSITVHDKGDGSEVKLTASMIKTDDGWRLKSVIF